MAAADRSIDVQCPSCGRSFNVAGVKGTVMANCPDCRSRIKITVPDRIAGPEPAAELSDVELDRYEGDITLIGQYHIIRNIVMKDLLSLKKILIVLFVLSMLLTGVMGLQSGSRDTDDPTLTAEEIKDEKIDGISTWYMLSLLITAPLLMLITNHVYGNEVKRGTMRLLTLYPVNMNGLSIAKIISTALILGIVHFLLLVLPSYPFNARGIYPWITSVMLMSYFMNLFIIITGTFATHIVTYLTGRLVITMNRLIAVLIVLYAVLTQTFFEAVGSFVTYLSNRPVEEADRIIHDYSNAGQALGWFCWYCA